MKLRRIILLAMVFVSCAVCAMSQSGFFIPSERFSSGMVNDVCQDKYGYIWVATDYGLNKYDGFRFTTYLHQPAEKSSVRSNVVTCLYCDDKGQLWIGTSKGLDRYDYATDSFEHYNCGEKIKPRITEILQRHDGSMLAGTAGYGLFQLDNVLTEKRTLQRIAKRYAAANDDDFYSYILEDSRGRFWKSSSDTRLSMTDAKGVHPMRCGKGDIVGLEELNMGQMLVCGLHGLQVWNNGILQDAVIDLSVMSGSDITFSCTHKDRAGNIYIGTRGAGLYCLPVGSGKLERVECVCKDLDLQTAKVWMISEDRGGNIWVACQSKGLMILQRTPPQFHTWGFQSQGIQLGSVISSVCEGDGDITWCTVQGNGVYGFDATGRVKYHPKSPASAEFIHRDKMGHYWIGAANSLYAYDPMTGLSSHKLSVECDKINDMTDTGQGILYVSTFSRGLCAYNTATGEMRQYSQRMKDNGRGHLCNNWILAMMPDSKGRIWLATADGVSCYDPVSDSFNSLGWHKLLNEVMCFSLCETSRGHILIGTERGLYVYEQGKKEAVLFRAGGGLQDKAISYIVEAAGGDIWCATSSGIWQYDVRKRMFISHIKDYGLTGKEYTAGVGMHTDGDMVCFANSEGLTMFRPSQVTGPVLDLPAPSMTAFLLAGHPINTTTTSNGETITDKPVMESDYFRLSYLDNTVTMEFSLLGVSQQADVIFEYRINDGEWMQTPEGYNTIQLSHLQPGKYRLEVRAQISGTYSKPRMFTIEVTPPWYKSVWAYLLYIILISGIIILAGWMWRHHAAQQLDEEKMKFLINATHDIRSPLTLIMGAVGKLKGMKSNDMQPADVQSSVDAIDRNANRLMVLVNQILDERRLDKNQLRLHCRETNIIEFVNGICKLYQYSAEQRGITFAFDHDKTEIPVWIDRINFDKVISNILSNAFKYTFDDGEIRVNVKDDETSVYIQVMDSGLGLKPEDMEHIFDRFYQGRNADDLGLRGTGIGLNLSKAITEMHSGSIKASVRPDGQRGACFTVTLPKGNAHLTPEQIVMQEDNLSHVAPASAQGGKQAKPYRLLIVDDDLEIANYIISELGSRYRFDHAPNGREGLKMLLSATTPYDLVVSDVMMPEMDGISMLKRIKENPQVSQTPVIMLTSKAEVEHKLEGLKNGADAYIAKPFNMEELHIQIDNLIDGVRRLKGKFSGAVQQKERIANLEVKGNDDALMERIMRSINAHISESDYNVDSLAEDVGISRAQLHRKMKEITGIASGKFLRNLRMEQAARLLSEGKVGVAQVAYKVGYADQAHFSTAFKTHFGLSPSEYAEKHKND